MRAPGALGGAQSSRRPARPPPTGGWVAARRPPRGTQQLRGLLGEVLEIGFARLLAGDQAWRDRATPSEGEIGAPRRERSSEPRGARNTAP